MKVFKVRRKIDFYWETSERDDWCSLSVNWKSFELFFEKNCVRINEWEDELFFRLFCELMRVNDFFYVNFESTVDDFVMLMRFFNDWVSTSDINFDVIINCEELVLSTFCIML